MTGADEPLEHIVAAPSGAANRWHFKQARLGVRREFVTFGAIACRRLSCRLCLGVKRILRRACAARAHRRRRRRPTRRRCGPLRRKSPASCRRERRRGERAEPAARLARQARMTRWRRAGFASSAAAFLLQCQEISICCCAREVKAPAG